MSTLDTSGIGIAHNELAQVSAHLRADGHLELAAEYHERAETEQTVYLELRSLGQIAREAATDSVALGARLARTLVADGWTPPAHFNGRITE